MNLTRKLTKFSIIPALVFALISTDSKAQTQYNVESLGQKAKSYDLRDTYRDEVIKKNLKQNLNLGVGFLISTPQDSYLRSHFPMQYGAELGLDLEITKNLKANTFVNFLKGSSIQKQEREISNSSVGVGVEYNCKGIVDLGVGIINRNQEISGPKNGFPEHLNKTGFYIQAKKEIPIIPEELSLYFKARLDRRNNEFSAGLIFKP